MSLLFGGYLTKLSMIFDQTVNFIETYWGHLLKKNWGSTLENVCYFLDGIVCPFCKFKVQQHILHNGNKQSCCENTIRYKSL